MSLLEQVKQQLGSDEFEMPNLPHVATQALAMAHDDRATSAQLANLICQDQSLATNLLRVANSPAYAGVRSIASLQQAITRLGMQTIADLAITICVHGAVFPKKLHKELSGSLWKHSLATALFAKEVARQQRHNVEAAYLCGLLHRIGMPLVLKAVTEVRSKNEQPPPEEMEDLLGILHVDAGLRASASWNLPSQVSEVIRHSDDYERAEQHRHLAAVVNLSQALAHALIAEQGFESVAELPVLEELSMYPDHLTTVVANQERIRGAIAA